MNIEQVNINELKPYEKNSRLHSDEQIIQISNSIDKWGWTIPILIDEDKTILAGHARFEAGKLLDYKEVPCIQAKDWTEEQKRAYVIADNKLAENSSWDMGLYYTELKFLNEQGFDLNLVGVNNFDNMEFTPNVDPSSNHSFVDSGDFENAHQNIQKQIDGSATPLHEGGIKVMCPKCAEEFIVSGY